MGASLQTIADEYGLGCERIRKITQHVCRSANPNLYRTMNRSERGPKVGERQRFLPRAQGGLERTRGLARGGEVRGEHRGAGAGRLERVRCRPVKGAASLDRSAEPVLRGGGPGLLRPNDRARG